MIQPEGAQNLTEHTSTYRKIDGYKLLFEEDGKEEVRSDPVKYPKQKIISRGHL